jgi:hypothetical protein
MVQRKKLQKIHNQEDRRFLKMLNFPSFFSWDSLFWLNKKSASSEMFMFINTAVELLRSHGLESETNFCLLFVEIKFYFNIIVGILQALGLVMSDYNSDFCWTSPLCPFWGILLSRNKFCASIKISNWTLFVFIRLEDVSKMLVAKLGEFFRFDIIGLWIPWSYIDLIPCFSNNFASFSLP